MAIPRAVQRELEQAEALQAQQVSQAAAQASTVEMVTDLSQMAPAQEPPAAPTAAPPAPTPAPTAPPRPDDGVDWKQRFLTTQGILQSQMPALQAAKLAAESRAAELNAQLTQMQSQLQQTAKTEPATPTVDPRDLDQFGGPMMDMVQRYLTGALATVKTQFAQAVGHIDGRVRALEGSLQGVNQRTENSLEAQFWAHLAQLVPDHEEVNASDGWKTWLAQVDRLTGRERQELLNAAREASDAKRVAEFFAAYKATIPPPASAALAQQVSPSAGGAADPPPAPAATQIITQDFIKKFYHEISRGERGQYSGRAAEVARIEAAINQAAAEGRVR